MQKPSTSPSLRRPAVTACLIVAVQAVVLAVGWFVVFTANNEAVAQNVEGIILDNNRRVAESLAGKIGDLSASFDDQDQAWRRAQELVENIEFGSGGFACIIDASGHIVCHPDLDTKPFLRDVNLGEHTLQPVGDDAGTTPTRIDVASFDAGYAEFNIDGKHYIATRPIGENGPRLLVHQPVSGLEFAVSQATAGQVVRMSIVGGVTLILSAMIAMLLTRAHSRAVRSWGEELEVKVDQKTQQLRTSREAIVVALAKLADFRDNETGLHVMRISEYCVVLSKAMRPSQPDIDDAWIERIRLASMLHDIGKVEVPDAVLRKPGKLTDEEFDLIKRHPLAGADTLLAIHEQVESDPLIAMAVEICLYHHEKWDGNGYPYRLSADDIPLPARITAVADVFDALLSKRVYKPAMTPAEVREIIVSSSGSHFDPAVVTAFESTFDELMRVRADHEEVYATAGAGDSGAARANAA